MKTYYIGADVHNNNTELAIEHSGNIVCCRSVPTTIPAIKEVLASVGGKMHLTFEEGPMAGWLYRNLKNTVEEIVICDPRRNKLICSDGDTDDKIDAGKLAALLRGKYLRAVYHSEDEDRVRLKEWVCLYHDRVHDAIRMINKIHARCRMNGTTVPGIVIREPAERRRWLNDINNNVLAAQLRMLWISFDAVAKQVKISRQQLQTLSRPHTIVKLFSDLPGIGLIRAVTLFSFLDTPWRFANKSRLWKYCGVGLQRATSGTDKKGKPKPAKLQLAWAANKALKNVILGAALCAISSNENVFKCYYERKIYEGIIPSNARHATARKMLTVMWGMWKQNSRFNEELAAAIPKTVGSLHV